jgi:hypothetical protein
MPIIVPNPDCPFQCIVLTNSPLQAFVSNEDYETVLEFSWLLTDNGYIRTTTNEKLLLHHLILGPAACYGFEVHHKNENKLDNCRWNLEILTKADHKSTRPPQKRNSLGYKGVKYQKCRGRFVASIMHNYKSYHLGSFDDATSAARAYDQKVKELGLVKAYLNFPCQ